MSTVAHIQARNIHACRSRHNTPYHNSANQIRGSTWVAVVLSLLPPPLLLLPAPLPLLPAPLPLLLLLQLLLQPPPPLRSDLHLQGGKSSPDC
jgi:hypothetical protein